MDDCPVDAHRLEVIDSGSGERLYTAMRDQAERGREFRRRVRWMRLRRELSLAPVIGSVIDLRDALPTQPGSVQISSTQVSSTPVSSTQISSTQISSVPVNSMVVPLERRQED